MILSLRIEVARITASLKKIGVSTHLDQFADMRIWLYARERLMDSGPERNG